jgi:hypothetical protein
MNFSYIREPQEYCKNGKIDIYEALSRLKLQNTMIEKNKHRPPGGDSLGLR